MTFTVPSARSTSIADGTNGISGVDHATHHNNLADDIFAINSLPGQVVAHTALLTAGTGLTTTNTYLSEFAVTPTLVSGRTYRISAVSRYTPVTGTSATAGFLHIIQGTSTAGTVLQGFALVELVYNATALTGAMYGAPETLYKAAASGATAFGLTGNTGANTAGFACSATLPGWMLVEDMGVLL